MNSRDFELYRERAKKAAAARKRNNPHWRRPEHADSAWKAMAYRYVELAKDNGFLPVLDGSIPCTDCGVPASQYDHRDYSRPLDVEPVCRSCNLRRGTAIWPMPKTFPRSDEAA